MVEVVSVGFYIQSSTAYARRRCKLAATSARRNKQRETKRNKETNRGRENRAVNYYEGKDEPAEQKQQQGQQQTNHQRREQRQYFMQKQLRHLKK